MYIAMQRNLCKYSSLKVWIEYISIHLHRSGLFSMLGVPVLKKIEGIAIFNRLVQKVFPFVYWVHSISVGATKWSHVRKTSQFS